ncbi:MAG TPA: molybdopterin-binding protein [Thermodesulfobacteriota bacterium]|nr:molybdopterin-binding protein [Thermodesulfobacteriota bacterium]
MLEKIKVQDAIGTVLAHDITEIKAHHEFKGRAFKKGHIISKNDISRLLDLGKEHLFVLKISDDEVHEDEAGERIARAIAGKGVYLSDEVKEGRVNLYAAYDGLLRINSDALEELNLLDEVMCATRHNNFLVKKGEMLAGTRAIPLLIKKQIVEKVEKLSLEYGKIVEVLPLGSVKAGLLITGSEIYHGRIKDAFEPIMRKKIKNIGSEIVKVIFVPDDVDRIAGGIKDLITAGAQLIITTGGMSVDPDDVTIKGITLAGAKITAYGSSVLPGAMFLMAYLDEIPIMGVPACGMYYKTTIFDLILPRVLVGEKIGKLEIAKLGHGGLCLDCPTCDFPHCGFGKGA